MLPDKLLVRMLDNFGGAANFDTKDVFVLDEDDDFVVVLLDDDVGAVVVFAVDEAGEITFKSW